MAEANFFLNIGIIFSLLFIFSYICEKIKLSPIIGFLLAGLSVGFLIAKTEEIAHLGELGIVFLFFLLGAEFPLSRVKEMMSRSWYAGLIDLFFNFFIAAVIAFLFNLSLTESFLIGAICYASSSSIILKGLEDNRRTASSETEFIVELLIFEDIIAPILVSIALALNAPSANGSGLGGVFLSIVLLILIAVGTAYLVGKLSPKRDIDWGNDSAIIFLAALGIFYAGFSMSLGASEALGAFLAGIIIAETREKEEIATLITPLRNTFLPIYFFIFASTLELSGGINLPWLIVILVIWALVGKILTALLGGKKYNLGPRARWRAGFSLMSRGEFSVLIASVGLPWLKAWGGIYIILTALLGTILLQLAPVIVRNIFTSFASSSPPPQKS